MQLRVHLRGRRAADLPAGAHAFPYDVAIYVPPAFTLAAGATPPLGTLTREGDVLHWRFTPVAAGRLTLRVAFE